MDWTSTPLGPPDRWPQSLRTCLNIMLASRHPMFLWWGEELIQFYNDGYPPILGKTKHPVALGQRGKACWEEIWEVIEPMITAVRERGESILVEDGLLMLNRHGYREECYFTYGYSPIRDEAGEVGGVLVACSETTDKIIGQRRLKTQRDLASHCHGIRSSQEVYVRAAEVLGQNLYDIPFSLFYEVGEESTLRLVSMSGIEAGERACPEIINFAAPATTEWPVAEVIKKKKPLLVENLNERFGPLPPGVWSVSPQSALVFPINLPGKGETVGVMVAAINPKKQLEPDYRTFYDLVVKQIANVVADAKSYEQERQQMDESQMLLIIDAVPSFISYLDSDLHYRFVNRAYEHWFERSKKEVIGRPAREVVGEEVYQHSRPLLLKALSGEGVSFETTLHKANQRISLKVDYVPDVSADGSVKGLVVLANDITEHKLAEDKLKQIQTQLNHALTAGSIDTWELDIAKKRVFTSTRLPYYFGVEPADAGLLLEDLMNSIHADDREQVIRTLNEAISSGSTYEAEYRVRGKDNKVRWVVARGMAEMDERGRPVRLAGALVDITSLKKVEEALKQSENLMKLVTDSLPAFIAYISPDKRYRFANKTYETWFDLPKEKIIGKHMKEVLGEETYSRSEVPVEKVLSGHFATYENVIQKDGEIRHLQLEYVPDIASEGFVRGFVVLAHDITQHKQAEETLRKNEEYYREMADNTPVMTWVTGPDGECTYMNKQWHDYTGQTTDKVVGFGWLEAVHPDDATSAEEDFIQAHEEKNPFSLEYRLKGKDGQYRWCLDTGLPKYDDAGHFEGFVGAVIDIHERKLAEEQFKLVVESSPSSLIMLDESGRITIINTQTENLFGYSREELIGASIEKLVPQRFRSGHPAYRKKFRQHPVSRPMGAGRDLYALRKDGREVPVEIALNPIKTDQGLYVLSSIIDITERKKAEQALKESEEFSRTLLESSPDCVKALDLEGRLLSINSQGLIMLGIEDFAKYRGMKWSNLWKGDHYEEAIMALEKARIGHLGHFQGRSVNVAGTADWWDVLVAPVYGVAGNVERLVAVSRNITKLKALEQQKDDFIGIASHELKTPVTSIKAYVQVLQKRLEHTDSLTSDMLVKVDGQLDRLTNLITNLLDVTKIEQGKLQYKESSFDFNELISEVIEDIQRTAERHEIIQHLSPAKRVFGDRERLGQVIINLLSNAIKYSPKANKIIVTTDIQHNDELIFSVRDFGLGLSKEDEEKVFERFYRVEGTGYETYPGLGLGLYICAGIIQRHQGRIWVKSERGVGSTFYFSLPLKAN